MTRSRFQGLTLGGSSKVRALARLPRAERASKPGVELEPNGGKTMREIFALPVLFLCVGYAAEAGAEQSRYSKALQQACMADYKKLCGEYGIEPRRSARAWIRMATA